MGGQPSEGAAAAGRVVAGRIATIDALRGLVMLLMLVDHAREFFLALFGPNQGSLFSVPDVRSLWVLAALVSFPLGFACRWFVRLKARTRSAWMSYL